jgi:hypothetical protein
MSKQNKYIDLTFNGRLFPTWILANFKEYKLPEIIRNVDEDPCNIKKSKESIRKYQEFLSRYLDFRSPYRDILIYHGLGSGKTATAINIYNVLYNFSPKWNVFLLLKAGLHKTTWFEELNKWIKNDEEREFRLKNIVFIHYDSPFADKEFLESVKNADTSNKSLYIIEEAHNFIRNVYSNITGRKGKRAQVIYEHILRDKLENEDVRVVLISGTPIINNPFELSLLFNLLRPNIFPKSESLFNELFVSSTIHPTINPIHKNMFQRRIIGLVSYYIGTSNDLYAKKRYHTITLKMEKYQQEIYDYFRDIEYKINQKKGGTSNYKTYTRQSCNFVFPFIAQKMMGEDRPRPYKFKLTDEEMELVMQGKMKNNKYMLALSAYIEIFRNYIKEKMEIDEKTGYTLHDDMKNWGKKIGKYMKSETKKSETLQLLYMCSPKMINIIFRIFKSKGLIMVYSNYVLGEGLDIFKIYLETFGFTNYTTVKGGRDKFRYIEFHGGIEKTLRHTNLNIFRKEENKYGDIIKIILISPAGSEGLSIFNIRQVHIMEPYWNEVRIQQAIGRAVRLCGHKNLPLNERIVDIYRYMMTGKTITADEEIYTYAIDKQNLIDTFFNAMKEVAVDCNLNKTHNDVAQCFQFDEPSLFDKQIGPAYKEEIQEDMRINNGLNNVNSILKKIKAYKISAVKLLSEEKNLYSDPENYWANLDNGVIYDFDLHYPIGKIGMEEDGTLTKLNKDTYIIDKMISIPMIKSQ